MQKVAITSAEFLADVSSREKEKAKEAKGNDLVFGQGLRRKGKGDQFPDDQAFYGKKGIERRQERRKETKRLF